MKEKPEWLQTPRMWGTLTEEMRDEIRKYVHGKEVWDLGAGFGKHSLWLAENGAGKVVCVEPKEKVVLPTERLPIEIKKRYFHDFNPTHVRMDVAFVSWPQGGPLISEGLVALMERADTVIYVGCNFGGTACGSPKIFRHFLQRHVLAHIPDERNTCLIYDKMHDDYEYRNYIIDESRDLYAEEFAALSGSVWAYSELPNGPLPLEKWVQFGIRE